MHGAAAIEALNDERSLLSEEFSSLYSIKQAVSPRYRVVFGRADRLRYKRDRLVSGAH